jgi:hypothetical protein
VDGPPRRLGNSPPTMEAPLDLESGANKLAVPLAYVSASIPAETSYSLIAVGAPA